MKVSQEIDVKKKKERVVYRERKLEGRKKEKQKQKEKKANLIYNVQHKISFELSITVHQ